MVQVKFEVNEMGMLQVPIWQYNWEQDLYEKIRHEYEKEKNK